MTLNPFVYGRSCRTHNVPGSPALSIEDVHMTYPGAEVPALDGVSLTVNQGERIALLGPNGAGKSTLIRAIAGLVQPQQGEITIYGNPAGACHHRVGYVPQRGDVDWRFPVNVREVITMGRYPLLGWLKRPGKQDHAIVDNAMDLMNLHHLSEKQIGDLSGGQQQRVMIARTLAQEADVLLLDEPLNNLDVPSQETIFHVLEDLAEQGRTMIVSTHDLGVIPSHFSRAVFMDRRIIADGPATDLATGDMLARAYGIHLCIDDQESAPAHAHH